MVLRKFCTVVICLLCCVAVRSVAVSQQVDRCNGKSSISGFKCAEGCERRGTDDDEFFCDPTETVSMNVDTSVCMNIGEGALAHCREKAVSCGHVVSCDLDFSPAQGGTVSCIPGLPILDQQGNMREILTIDTLSPPCIKPPVG